MEVTSPDMGENWIWSAKGDIGEMSAKADGDILEGVMPGDLPGVALPGVMGPKLKSSAPMTPTSMASASLESSSSSEK